MSVRHATATIAAILYLLLQSIASVVRADQRPATAPTSAPTSMPTTTAATSKSHSIENHGELTITIPAGWTVQEDPATPGIPRTLRLTDPAAKFEMLISILPPPAGMPDFNSKTKLRAIAEAQGKHLLASSKETKVVLEEIKSAPGGGFVYTLADKSPAPGSYEFITGGVVGVGDLILSTTMLMHERNPPQRATGLELLASATQVKRDAITAATAPSGAPAGVGAATGAPTGATTEPTAGLPSPSATSPTTSAVSPSSQPAQPPRIAVSLPDRAWQLSFEQGALQVLEDEMSPDHKARHLSAVDANTGVNISIFLEPAATMGDAKVARSFFFDRLKRSPLQIRDDKFTDIGEIARVDYMLPDASQRHANLYLAKEGIWIDVHISVEDAKGEKQALIDDIARSARIEAKSPIKK